MNRLLPLTSILVAVLIGLCPAAFADPQWYVSGKVGGADFSRVEARGAMGTVSQVDLDAGIFASGAVGAQVSDYFRGELELSYVRNNVDRFFMGGINVPAVAGHTQVFSSLANLYVDFLPGKKIRPYISGGIGLARVKTDFTGPVAIFPGGVVSNDSDTVFAWQVGAGASVAVTPNFDVVAGYRYFGTDDLRLDIVSVKGLGAHQVVIGARRKF